MTKYPGAPFYPDSMHCTCDHLVSNNGLVNCELEPDYKGIHQGECQCGMGYAIITGMFKGANGETYWAEYDSTRTLVTRSGCLTQGGKWDKKAFIKIQRAKDLNLQIILNKKDADSI